jgi:hypothetical protein
VWNILGTTEHILKNSKVFTIYYMISDLLHDERIACSTQREPHKTASLLVERLGVGGGGGDVSVTGSLVGASGELQSLGSLEVGVTRALVRASVVSGKVEVFSKAGEHCGLWVKHCSL